MRISDWSSDVCSSDLERAADEAHPTDDGLGDGGDRVEQAVLREDDLREPERHEHPAHRRDHRGQGAGEELGESHIYADRRGGSLVDWKSDVEGKRVSGREEPGGCRFMKKKRKRK